MSRKSRLSRRTPRSNRQPSFFEVLEKRRLLSAAITHAARPVLTPAANAEPKPIFIDDGGVGAGRTSDDRWTATATNGTNVGSLGDGITLTWSVVPDGTLLGSAHGEPNAGSNFQSKMVAKFGASWLNFVQHMFNQWSAVTGITYQYVSDDGAAFPDSPGVLGARGDVRIGSHPIDGLFNVLAYNYLPNGGDMVVDSDDLSFGSTQQLQNVLAHEHGHGMGLSHVLPGDHTKLMEPIVNTNFVGPQFDDIYRAQVLYGDVFEKGAGNDVQANSVQLGTELGVNSHLSLSGTTDQDWFKFTLSTRKRIDVTTTPEGSPYMVGEDGATPTTFNPAIQADMKLELWNSSGTILGSSNNPGTGNMESIGMDLNPGTYYAHILRVSGDTQMYSLSVQSSESAPIATIAPVSPDPRSSPVTAMTISFDKPVNGFDLSDLSLSRDTNATPLSGATLTTSDNQTFTLGNLSTTTDHVGTFTLTLNAAGSGITSQAGNVAITQNANESWLMTQINGTGGNDNIRLVNDGIGLNHTDVYANNVFQYWFFNNASFVLSASLGGGNDTLNVDYTYGQIGPDNSLLMDSGSGTDTLLITGTNSGETFNVSNNLTTMGNSSVNFAGTEVVNLSMLDGINSAIISATAGVSVQVGGGGNLDSVTFNNPAPNSFMVASRVGFSSNTTTVTFTGSIDRAFMQGNSNPGVTFSASTAPARPLTITGGSADELFNVYDLDGTNYASPVTVDGGSGNDHLTTSDLTLAGNSTYSINSSQIQKDNGFAGLTYSNVETLDVIAESGGNAIYVYGYGSNVFNINAGAGDDTVTVAGNLGRTISPNGGDGTDSIVLADPPTNTWMIAGPNQLQSGQTYVSNPSNFESASMVGNNNQTVMIVTGTAAGRPLYLVGGAADDAFVLSQTNSANFPAAVIIDGAGGGNDQVLVDDSQIAGTSSYSINDVDLWKSNGFAGAHFTNVESASLFGEQGTNDFNVEMFGAGVAVSLNGGPTQDSYRVQTTGAGRPATILDSAGDDTLSLGKPSGFWYLPAQVVLGSSMTFGSISILPTSRVDVTAGSNSTITTKNLAFPVAVQAQINLNDNDFILDYSGASPMGTVQQWLNTARNGGAWDVPFFITSESARDNPLHNTTLGIMEASEYKALYGPGATFGGQPIDNTAVLVKYTVNGDATFDERVNVNDFTVLAGNFNQSNRHFSQGDFNYDGVVNVADFTILAGAFGTALAPDGSIQGTGERLDPNMSLFGATRIGDSRSGDDRLIGMLA